MANVYANHAHDTIMPIVATSIVGMKLLERLLSEGRLHSRPDVLFLDSAHEADETFMELQHAWSLLRSGGILLGDDWSWSSVSNDVWRFANGVDNIDTEKLNKVKSLIHGEFDGAVLVVEADEFLLQWTEGFVIVLSKVELNGPGRASLSRAGGFSFPTIWVVSELRETQTTGGGAVSAGKDQRCQFDRK